MADAWHDHPLWIREDLLKGRVNWYWLVHLGLVFAITIAVLPAVSAGYGALNGIMGDAAMFPIFGASVVVLIAILYALFFLPIRVCGESEPMGYLCAISSLFLPWFFMG